MNYSNQESRDREKFMEIMNKYLPNYVHQFFLAANQRQSPKTRLAYAKDLKIFCTYIKQSNPLYHDYELKDIPLDALANLSTSDIDEYMVWLESYLPDGIDPKKITEKELNKVIHHNDVRGKARKLACLRSFFRFLNKRDYIKNNPVINVDNFKIKENEIITFKHEEKVRLMNHIKANEPENMTNKRKSLHEKLKLRDYAMFMTLFGTGLRVSELTGLDIEDVDFEFGTMYVHRKGGKNETIYFGHEVSDALLSYLDEGRIKFRASDDEHALFLSSQGRRITDRMVEKTLENYSNEVFGIHHKFSPHKLRSTFGTQLYAETGDIYMVASTLGHSNVETTRKHYAKITEEHKKTAATMQIM